MCCFSQPVTYVGSTSIYARLDGNRQWLAYQMVVESPQAVAMVLPLPVPPDGREDAACFHDLSAYPDLFRDLDRAWPRHPAPRAVGGGLDLNAARPQTLAVREVGDFDASFVPRPADFVRLDSRFRLSSQVLAQLPQYADWGFAVFQLRPPSLSFMQRLFGGGQPQRRSVHPMALSFPTRDPSRVFFPTVHVHDGEVHEHALFDHTLYVQADTEASTWERASKPIAQCVDLSRTSGLVLDGHCSRRKLSGRLDNTDIWLGA